METFAGCTSLTTIPTDLFKYATLASTSAFFCTFYGCSSLTNIPNGIFNYNTLVNGNAFDGTFKYCSSVTSIPTSLFQYNTLVMSFYDTFASSGIVHVPYQIFDYNTLVTSFYDTFRNCADLLTVPSGLFEHNTLATNFDSTFRDCVNFQLNANMFSSAAGWESTRFKNQSPNFSNCFSRAAFTGARGDAPDLWTCDYGTGTPITTGCFGDLGNSLVSLSNYASIPSGWK